MRKSPQNTPNGLGSPPPNDLIPYRKTWRRIDEDDEPLSRLNSHDELEAYSPRFKWLFLAFLIPVALIVGRLWQLQILDQSKFDEQARNNLVRTVEIPPARGLIFDSNGLAVAKNRPSYNVYITPRIFKEYPNSLQHLKDALNLSDQDTKSIERKVQRASGQTFLAKRDVSRDQVALIATNIHSMRGVEVRPQAHRHYPYNEHSAHLIGFMNEIRADELAKRRDFGYRPGDYVGRMGLERSYEAILRGSPGLERQIVDARNIPQSEDLAEEILGHYRRVEPIPGRNIHLTTDMRFQKILAEEFAAHPSGAAVALDPRDGSVLGLMSKPFFNPNSWSGRLSREEKRRNDDNPFKPMIDKTVHGYFPGSTFKLVSAAAVLSEGWIKPFETLNCSGRHEFGGHEYHCWNRTGHGSMNLIDSLKHSCDVYYYKMAEKVGMDSLARYAFLFGFGERAGLGVNGEQRGIVPTKDWYRRNSPEGWIQGHTLGTIIGQVDVRTTPLQMSLAFGALANGGTLYYPRIVDRITNPAGHSIFEYPSRIRRKLNLSEDVLQHINAGMGAVVNERTGTSYTHRLDYINVAGKTGTAQVKALNKQRIGPDGSVIMMDRDHAWFVAYAPIEDPYIVLTVFVEHGQSGGKVAAPLAMRILDRYFREIVGINPEEARAHLTQTNRRRPRRLSRNNSTPTPTSWKRPDPPSLRLKQRSEVISNIDSPTPSDSILPTSPNPAPIGIGSEPAPIGSNPTPPQPNNTDPTPPPSAPTNNPEPEPEPTPTTPPPENPTSIPDLFTNPDYEP